MVAAPAHPRRRVAAHASVRRGTLRGLRLPGSFTIVLAAVAVGWLLPVLGVSLLLFVAGDAAVGAIARRRAG